MLTSLPKLRLERGGHGPHQPEGCVMEVVSLLLNQQKSDHPLCINEVITATAINLNDRLGPQKRQQLLPLIPRILRAGRTTRDGAVNRRLLQWIEEHSRSMRRTHGWAASGICPSCGIPLDDDEVIMCDDCVEADATELANTMVSRPRGRNFDPVLWFSDLLDAHEKAIVEEGLLLEKEFCAFAAGKAYV